MKNNLKVLLVDDEPELLQNLTFDLREDITEFLTATDGKDALTIFNENKYNIDLIISDIKMPKMNGLQFVQEVRKSDQKIPVIFLTAHGDEEQMKIALSLGANDFIRKPYDLYELRDSIDSIVNEEIEVI